MKLLKFIIFLTVAQAKRNPNGSFVINIGPIACHCYSLYCIEKLLMKLDSQVYHYFHHRRRPITWHYLTFFLSFSVSSHVGSRLTSSSLLYLIDLSLIHIHFFRHLRRNEVLLSASSCCSSFSCFGGLKSKNYFHFWSVQRLQSYFKTEEETRILRLMS